MMKERLEKQKKIQKAKEERQKVQDERKKEKERIRIEKENQDKIGQEQEDSKKRKLEEDLARVKQQIEDMEMKRTSVEKRRVELEKESYRIGKELCKLLERDCDEVIYLSSVSHQHQQTEIDVCEIQKLTEENEQLKKRLAKMCSFSLVADNEELCTFYTGLSSKVFRHIFTFLSPHVTQSNSLSLEDEFLFVMMRLRLGLPFEDLAVRFDLSASTASRNFQKWLEVMYWRLKFLIKWPSREIVKQNMPPAFKQLYPDCICIIDCSEIYIDTPTNFAARSATFSNYKKHNTVKFLIAITPCGSISFLSKCWGGRVSDKVLTQESGFLNLIEPGNTILADRGFTISDDWPFKEQSWKYQHSPVGRVNYPREKLNTQNNFLP